MMDWESKESHALLNPALPKKQAERFSFVFERTKNSYRGHIYLLSSGTTAKNKFDLKWVALRKEAILNSAAGVNRHIRSDRHDVWIHNLPDFHVGGLGIWARAHLSKAQVVKVPRWNCDEFLIAARTKGGTLCSLVPAQVYDLVSRNIVCPPTLRAILVGGGALSPALFQKAIDLGWPLLPTYGMTEAGSQIATASLNSLGRVAKMDILPHLDVALHTDGRLKVKGSSLFSAYIYWNGRMPAIYEPFFDHWFITQDRGELNGRQLQITGRTGDFVKIGGESVEVGRLNSIFDGARIQLGIAQDVSLLPVPDDRLGYVIHLISDSELSTDLAVKLMDHYNSQVLPFEKIRKWHRLGFIPRTSLGKLIQSDCLRMVMLAGEGVSAGL
jgi:O-succinylbenzoic acid--CoA ligase